MTCPSCQMENPYDSLFCAACGQKLERQRFCRFCGQKIPENIEVCPACGGVNTPIPPASHPAAAAPAARPDLRRYRWLLAGIPALLLILLAYFPWVSIPAMGLLGQSAGRSAYTLFDVQKFADRLYDLAGNSTALYVFEIFCSVAAFLTVAATIGLVLAFVLKWRRIPAAKGVGVFSCVLLFVLGLAVFIGIALVNDEVSYAASAMLGTSSNMEIRLLAAADGLWGTLLLSAATGAALIGLWRREEPAAGKAAVGRKAAAIVCLLVECLIFPLFLGGDGYVEMRFLLLGSILLQLLTLHPFGSAFLQSNPAVQKRVKMVLAVLTGLQITTLTPILVYVFLGYYHEGSGYAWLIPPYGLFLVLLLGTAIVQLVKMKGRPLGLEESAEKQFRLYVTLPVLAALAVFLLIGLFNYLPDLIRGYGYDGYRYDGYGYGYGYMEYLVCLLSGTAPLFWAWTFAYILPSIGRRFSRAPSELAPPAPLSRRVLVLTLSLSAVSILLTVLLTAFIFLPALLLQAAFTVWFLLLWLRQNRESRGAIHTAGRL